jgi:CheY-like chemotaxis protein
MARVLVVDDDPWTQRMVSSVLSHQGHNVELAADGWEALISAGRTRPDLVIVDVQLPTTDGWKLVGTLRSRSELGGVPTLFLTDFSSEETRGASFRTALDETIAKPFRLEDLLAKVTTLLVRVGVPPVVASARTLRPTPIPPPTMGRPTPSDGMPTYTRTSMGASLRASPPPLPLETRTALAGVLGQFGLSSVLVLLDLERKSGVTTVTGRAGRGRVFVRDGRVIRAVIEAAHGGRSGAIAVYELLTWSEGRFEFHPGEVEGDDEIGSSTSFLLMEGARLEDERRAVANKSHN